MGRLPAVPHLCRGLAPSHVPSSTRLFRSPEPRHPRLPTPRACSSHLLLCRGPQVTFSGATAVHQLWERCPAHSPRVDRSPGSSPGAATSARGADSLLRWAVAVIPLGPRDASSTPPRQSLPAERGADPFFLGHRPVVPGPLQGVKGARGSPQDAGPQTTGRMSRKRTVAQWPAGLPGS